MRMIVYCAYASMYLMMISTTLIVLIYGLLYTIRCINIARRVTRRAR